MLNVLDKYAPKIIQKKGIAHIAISFDECCLELVTS